MMRRFQALVFVTVAVGLACTSRPVRIKPAPAGLVDLQETLAPLRQQFELDRDLPRAVVLLSPT